jgi:hypothetical protein
LNWNQSLFVIVRFEALSLIGSLSH